MIKGERGSVLLQLVVFTTIIMILIVGMLQSSFASRTIQSKLANNAEAAVLIEGLHNRVMNCLVEQDYEATPSCASMGEKAACFPKTYKGYFVRVKLQAALADECKVTYFLK